MLCWPPPTLGACLLRSIARAVCPSAPQGGSLRTAPTWQNQGCHLCVIQILLPSATRRSHRPIALGGANGQKLLHLCGTQLTRLANLGVTPVPSHKKISANTGGLLQYVCYSACTAKPPEADPASGATAKYKDGFDGQNYRVFLGDARCGDLGLDDFCSYFLVGHLLWLSNSWVDLVDFRSTHIACTVAYRSSRNKIHCLGHWKVSGKIVANRLSYKKGVSKCSASNRRTK